ncbi:MAG: hypothetical protein O4805_18795 [Trichodesmium sp. St16_bin2-tuft]|nr:hypothetical protein [Trichodesmium sp. St16_bin2-tuft]
MQVNLSQTAVATPIPSVGGQQEGWVRLAGPSLVRECLPATYQKFL